MEPVRDINSGILPVVKAPEVRNGLEVQIDIADVKWLYQDMRRKKADGDPTWITNARRLDSLHRAVIATDILHLDPQQLRKRQNDALIDLSGALINQYGINKTGLRNAYNHFKSFFADGEVPTFANFLIAYNQQIIGQSHRLTLNRDGETYSHISWPRTPDWFNKRVSGPRLPNGTQPLDNARPIDVLAHHAPHIVTGHSEVFDSFERWWERVKKPSSTRALPPEIPHTLAVVDIETVMDFQRIARGKVEEAVQAREHYEQVRSVGQDAEGHAKAAREFGVRMLQSPLCHSFEATVIYTEFAEELAKDPHFHSTQPIPEKLDFVHTQGGYIQTLDAFLQENSSHFQADSPAYVVWMELVDALSRELQTPAARGKIEDQTAHQLVTDHFREKLEQLLGNGEQQEWMQDTQKLEQWHVISSAISEFGLTETAEGRLQQLFGIPELTKAQRRDIIQQIWFHKAMGSEVAIIQKGYDYNDRAIRTNHEINDAAFIAQVNTLLPGEGKAYLTYVKAYMQTLAQENFSWQQKLDTFQPSAQTAETLKELDDTTVDAIGENLQTLRNLYMLDSYASTDTVRSRLLWDPNNPKVVERILQGSVNRYNQEEETKYAQQVEDICYHMPQDLMQRMAIVLPRHGDSSGGTKITQDIEWLLDLVGSNPDSLTKAIAQNREHIASTVFALGMERGLQNAFQHIVILYPKNVDGAGDVGAEVPIIIFPPWVDKTLIEMVKVITVKTAHGTTRPLAHCVAAQEISMLPELVREMFRDIDELADEHGMRLARERASETTLPFYVNGRGGKPISYDRAPERKSPSQDAILLELEQLVDSPTVFDEKIESLAMENLKRKRGGESRKMRKWRELDVANRLHDWHNKQNMERSYFKDLIARMNGTGVVPMEEIELWSLLPRYIRRYLRKNAPPIPGGWLGEPFAFEE